MKNKQKSRILISSSLRKKNKRGDIPVTILVIGVFVVCTLALLSFFVSMNIIKNSFIGISLIEKANFQIEKNNLDNYYDEEKSSTGFLGFGKEKIVFSVEYKKLS